MLQKLKANLADWILFHNNRFDALDFWAVSVIERLDQDAWRRCQFRHVKQMLKHAYKNVPYWRKTLDSLGISSDEIRTIEDFAKLPILKKDTFRDRREEFDVDNWEKYSYTSTTTSGSSGNPLLIRHDKHTSRRHRILYMDYLRRFGLTDFRHFAHFFVNRPNLLTLGFPVNFLVMSKNPDSFCEFLSKEKIQAISGMVNYFIHLGEHMERSKISLDLKFIQTAGESLSLPVRKWLEDVFHCPVYNRYGCAELGCLGIECGNHDGFHVNVSHVFLEIVDQNGRPIHESDSPGKILVTTMSNKIMPLFRYEMGDTGEWMSGQCQCGLKTPRIRLGGRDLYFLKLPDGKKSSILNIIDFLANQHKFIKKFQIVQESLHEIILRAVITPFYNSQSELFLIQTIRNMVGEKSLIVNVEKTLSIPALPNGKSRVFISKL